MLIGEALRRDWGGPSMRGARLFPAAAVILTVYGLLSTGLMILGSTTPSATQFVLLAVIAATWLVRARSLVWIAAAGPAAALVFFGLDGFAARAALITQVNPPIASDRWLLGGGSVSVLQSGFLATSWTALLIPLLVLVYLSLWYGSVVVWVWLWSVRPTRIARFLTAFLLLDCIGQIIYLIYPEAPPWRAAQLGVLAPLRRVGVDFLQSIDGLGSWYAGSDPAPLAAMPAMHVAVPMLIALTLMASARRRWLASLWLAYPVSVGLSVILLGEHYLVDVLVAVALGATCFAVTEHLWVRSPRSFNGRDRAG